MRSVEVPEYEIHDEVRVSTTHTALVVVDMQNDFVKEGGTLVVPDAEATIPKIQGLLDLARGSGMRVVFTQDTHTDGDPEWEIWPEHVREGSWGWQIVDELAPREDELRSEEHTSELQSRQYLVCRLLLEKKKKITVRER